ncbi:MAG: hypothetical protein PHW77_06525 [Eubacteriales bacterium]|nr:hypothetical protein [Eubacteriales bacterium]
MPDDDFFNMNENDDDDLKLLSGLSADSEKKTPQNGKRQENKAKDNTEKILRIAEYTILAAGGLCIAAGGTETGIKIVGFGTLFLLAAFFVYALVREIIKGKAAETDKTKGKPE